jgi:dCMP deaminase
LGIPHGQRYEICRSVHAEQNAIINSARAGVNLLGGTMYIHMGEKIDSFPCYICKKMIINAGLEKVVCSAKEGEIKIFEIEDWIEDWKNGDIFDDKYQYGKDQNGNKDWENK